MNLVWDLILGWLGISCSIGFILMGIDKARAQDGEWRLPEKVLFEIAAVGGAFGVIIGSSIFHHKTLKNSFLAIICALAIAWVIILVGLTYWSGPLWS